MEIQEIIKIWKELKVVDVQYAFDCGGDSMGDTSITINTKKGEIKNADIEGYIESVIYDRVEFYVNSDGHYQGESGTVEITLDEDGEDFDFSKSSQSQWTEQHQSIVEILLTDEEADFVRHRVSNINGSKDEITVNYLADFILSDREEEIQGELERKLSDYLDDYEPTVDDGELEEWYSFTTNRDGASIEVSDNNELIVRVSTDVTVYRDE